MRRRFIAGLMLAGSLAAGGAGAQTFPAKQITIVVPFTAGGPTDTLARILAERMSRTLGQTVIVDNTTGAAGTALDRSLGELDSGFRKGLADYEQSLRDKVGYSPKPIVATSGKEVALAGSAALVVRLEQASGFNQDTGQSTYSGPKELKPGDTRTVKDLAQVEDFEAVLSWAVGVTSEAAFRVSTLTAPPRLVIDIAS